MSMTHPEHDDDLAGIMTAESERLDGHSRRRLLAWAAGGMAVAASGLFLPPWLQEAGAREGALGGTRGGRRGKNQRGRHHKRTHGSKKDKPRGGGPLNPRPFTFLIDVYSAHDPIKADFYSTRLRPGVGDNWELKASKLVARSAGVEFSTTDIKAAVWLDDRILISANARGVGVRIGHGGDFWAGNRGWQGGQTVFDDGLQVHEITQGYVMEGYRIRGERLPDDGDVVRYHVLVNPGY